MIDGYAKIFDEFRKLEPTRYGEYIYLELSIDIIKKIMLVNGILVINMHL